MDKLWVILSSLHDSFIYYINIAHLSKLVSMPLIKGWNIYIL